MIDRRDVVMQSTPMPKPGRKTVQLRLTSRQREVFDSLVEASGANTPSDYLRGLLSIQESMVLGGAARAFPLPPHINTDRITLTNRRDKNN